MPSVLPLTVLWSLFFSMNVFLPTSLIFSSYAFFYSDRSRLIILLIKLGGYSIYSASCTRASESTALGLSCYRSCSRVTEFRISSIGLLTGSTISCVFWMSGSIIFYTLANIENDSVGFPIRSASLSLKSLYDILLYCISKMFLAVVYSLTPWTTTALSGSDSMTSSSSLILSIYLPIASISASSLIFISAIYLGGSLGRNRFTAISYIYFCVRSPALCATPMAYYAENDLTASTMLRIVAKLRPLRWPDSIANFIGTVRPGCINVSAKFLPSSIQNMLRF